MKKTVYLKRKKILSFCVMLSCVLLFAFPETYAQYDTVPGQQPVYFHISHHQEDVGRYMFGFPKFQRFKENLKMELDLLDQYGAESDQCFSDFMVSVILYMDSTSDPGADSIFYWFNHSNQSLGYHFHPTTWDVMIRLDKIKNMDLDTAIMEYTKWEQAYYDWFECDSSHLDTTMFCGELDTTRTGGIQLMQQYFTKPVVNECLTMQNPAAGQVIRNIYGNQQPIIGQAGNVHSYYSAEASQNLWVSDWMFSNEPGIYVYKMMGNYYIQNRSEAWLEGLMDVDMLEQVLAVLPRDIPHIFAIHLTVPPVGDSTLEQQLKYLTNEFLPNNPESRFIAGSDIPEIIDTNLNEFSMSDLETACTYTLNQWHGRPPAFVQYGDKYTSLAALYKALQYAIKSWYNSPYPHVWPSSVSVPEFIWPPLGRKGLTVPFDSRLANGFPYGLMLQAIDAQLTNDSIPQYSYIPNIGTPMTTNASEFLNGMCTIFLRLRQGDTSSQNMLYILPSYIVPISYLPVETFLNDTGNHVPYTNMDWLSALQLWTTEPVRLKTVNQLSVENYNKTNNDIDFQLNQNYPNPFSESTTIKFFIAKRMKVRLDMYDMLGKHIQTLADGNYGQGWHTLAWNGANNAGNRCNGTIFFYRMTTENGAIQKKAVMIR
ncbi:MAG TPA: hypothetical protein PKW80_13585 [Bacteroidales bacterium]|nr:hypothetical protein [Bacteroidales bacterium]